MLNNLIHVEDEYGDFTNRYIPLLVQVGPIDNDDSHRSIHEKIGYQIVEAKPKSLLHAKIVKLFSALLKSLDL